MGALNNYGVSNVQTKLKAAGYDPGKIDNLWGSRTEGAVKAFQKAKGLTADGIVGANTWRVLNSAPAPAPAPSATPVTWKALNSATPSGFNEAEYLALNPDVAKAVKSGQMASGLAHYQKFGINEGRATSNLQDAYNRMKQNANQQVPSEDILRQQSQRAAGLQIDPQLEALKRATEQNNLNYQNQQDWTENQYADSASQLQKLYDQQRTDATNRMFGRGLGRSGLLEAQMGVYDTNQAQELNKSNRERDLKLGEIASQMGLGQKQAGEQEQQLAGRKGALEAQTYDELSKQARQEGNTNLAKLFEMASSIATKQFQEEQAALDQQWKQKQYDFGQQQYNSDQAWKQKQFDADQSYKNQQLALDRSKASSSSPSVSAQNRQDKLNSAQSTASAMQNIEARWAGPKDKGGQALSRSEILQQILSNAADFQANGVDVQELYKWAAGNYRYDKKPNGDWYNIDTGY